LTHTTLSIICDVRDPITKKEYSRDPRSITRKTAAYLKKSKIADHAFFRAGAGVLHLRSRVVRPGDQFREVLRRLARGHLGPRGRGCDEPRLQGAPQEGYFPPPPMDTMQNIRSEMVAELVNLGIPVEAHHHEVATGGQCEIDMRYQELLTMSDNVMTYKYVCKNVAARHGRW
jgi:glutamine synthetase